MILSDTILNYTRRSDRWRICFRIFSKGPLNPPGPHLRKDLSEDAVSTTCTDTDLNLCGKEPSLKLVSLSLFLNPFQQQ